MPDDLRLPTNAGGFGDAIGSSRHDRPLGLAFAADAATEAALRDGLADVLPALEVRRGGIAAAIAAQRKAANPLVLIVDVGGVEHPLPALASLSTVVEPDTLVLVVGDAGDLDLYREVTRGLGAAEYLPKPLGRDLVARHFGPLVRGQALEPDRVAGGRLVTVTGTRGGVGASILAASLALYFGTEARRHTVLVDADLHRGTLSLQLNAEPGEGLRAALEAPGRLDALLAERAAQPVSDRLHVLAAQEPLTRDIAYATGAAGHLLEALRRRYNMVLADVPWRADPFCRDILAAANRRVVVVTPTLPAIRDALRLLSQPDQGAVRIPTTIVLNRSGMPGGLKRAQVEETLRLPIDVVIPDLPRQVGHAITLGQPVPGGAFGAAIRAVAQQIGVHATATPAGVGPPRRRWWRRRA